MVNVNEALMKIGLANPFRPNMNISEAQETLESFKKDLRKRRKELALQFHPDRGGDGNVLAELNGLIDILLKIRIQVRQVQRPIIIRTYYHAWNSSTTYDSTTTSTYW